MDKGYPVCVWVHPYSEDTHKAYEVLSIILKTEYKWELSAPLI